jgi:hypothetical protein
MKFPSPRQIITSPPGRALIATAIAWLLAFFYCRGRYWRDPHSAFFKSETVYDQYYSKYRASQSQTFIEHAAGDTNLGKAKGTPEICAAFVTVKRETTQYVDNAVASVLEGLTSGEREKLFLYVLFADTQTGRHPSWKQPWLENAVDVAVGYNVTRDVLKNLIEWEEKKDWWSKGVLCVYPPSFVPTWLWNRQLTFILCTVIISTRSSSANLQVLHIRSCSKTTSSSQKAGWLKSDKHSSRSSSTHSRTPPFKTGSICAFSTQKLLLDGKQVITGTGI